MRSGSYEVDAEGNLVEAGSAAGATTVGDAVVGARREGAEETPVPVRRALRVYGFAQLLSFAILLVTAITIPDLRPLMLLVAVVYAFAAFFLHRLYRRALMRRYAGRAR